MPFVRPARPPGDVRPSVRLRSPLRGKDGRTVVGEVEGNSDESSVSPSRPRRLRRGRRAMSDPSEKEVRKDEFGR